jgi:hypothetical protein
MAISKQIRLAALRKINAENGIDFIMLKQSLRIDFEDNEIERLEYWLLSDTKFVCSNKFGRTILNENGKNELSKMELDNMSEGEKIHKLLEYMDSQGGFEGQAEDLMHVFNNSLNLYELKHMCQVLIDNGDVLKGHSKGNYNFKFNDASRRALGSKKYLKESNVSMPITISIGQLQNIQDSTINAPVNQSRDDLSRLIDNTQHKTIILPTEAEINKNPNNWTLSNITFVVSTGVLIGLILLYWPVILDWIKKILD